jgi:hypothetical protein
MGCCYLDDGSKDYAMICANCGVSFGNHYARHPHQTTEGCVGFVKLKPLKGRGVW